MFNSNKSIDSINTSIVNKYYYVNKGGSIWLAFALGAVIDVSMYVMFENNGLGPSSAMFMGPL